MNYKNKIIIVIGGSSGIGRGIASSYIDKGANVCITGTRDSINDYNEELYKGVNGYKFVKEDLNVKDIIISEKDMSYVTKIWFNYLINLTYNLFHQIHFFCSYLNSLSQ